jgi:tRNA modification GTPase
VTTLAACLTPSAAGAIAVISVRGPEAWQIVRGLFRARNYPDALLPEKVKCPQFWLGKLTGEALDDVVVLARRLEPMPEIEIHCHGGRQLVDVILQMLRDHKARVVTWQSLERETSTDPICTEAAIALADTPTTRTAAILLDQYHGAMSRASAAINAALQAGDLQRAQALLRPLAARCALGRHLTRPWRIVIAGAPNVGKSSLVNALAGYQRSIVAPTPGTTRDVVAANLAIDGWPVELSDTAGLHTAGEDLEREGMERARQAMAEADLCLWVLDGSLAPIAPDAEIRSPLDVINKIDLPAAWDFAVAPLACRVSAHTGAGLPELCDAISRRLVAEPPSPGDAVPFTEELCAWVEKSLAELT